MTSISHYPHDLNTKYYSVKLYRQTKSTKFVCRRYKISKASLMRWNKLFDGTKESLLNKSHKPLSKHPNAHTDEELKWIKDYMRRNPNITLPEFAALIGVPYGAPISIPEWNILLLKIGCILEPNCEVTLPATGLTKFP